MIIDSNVVTWSSQDSFSSSKDWMLTCSGYFLNANRFDGTGLVSLDLILNVAFGTLERARGCITIDTLSERPNGENFSGSW